MHACTLLPELKTRFDTYVNRFIPEDLLVQQNFDLKIKHTQRVREIIKDIGASENLSSKDLCIAEIAAMLHDIGRFEQYQRYRTFVDARSVDHAALGVKVIRSKNLLKNLESSLADMIQRVVQYHNKAKLPTNEDERCLFFLKLVRDADKIDIWHVVTQYYQNTDGSRNPGIELDLPDKPLISDGPYEALMAGELVQMSQLATLNDFKLLQLGWIYDLNFTRSFQLVRERKYLEKIHHALPRASQRVARIMKRVQAHLENNCSVSDCP